jgi:ACS family tartrate transporter-like MFS transporter
LSFAAFKLPVSSLGIAERTRRRVTRRLMPFLMFAYLLAYVDRANLSIAKLQMQGDLRFTDSIIGFGAGIFFVGYFLLEVPGTLIVERWSARRWLSRIMISWGIVATLTGFLGLFFSGGLSFTRQFYALRFLLGAAESGFFPGVIVYLSHWYRFEDRARAKTYFMLTQPLAIVIGYVLSRFILQTVHWHGLAGWRWVFILEGLPAIFLGIFSFFYLTDHPQQARWLPAEEKSWLIGELQKEARQHTAAGRVRIADALRQPYTLLLIAIYFLIVSANQGLIFFLPSVIDEMKSMTVVARTAVTMLPYLLGIITILLAGFSAHRTGERRWHTAGPMLFSAIALALAILSGNHLVLVIAFFCLAAGTSQAYLPAFWTLPTAYLGKSAAATAIGLINSFGSLGGFAGPYAFGYLRTATGNFNAGLWSLAGCCSLAGLLATQIRPVRVLRNQDH